MNFFSNSETVKFGHVTFFWNGNRSGYFNEELEEYVEIPSDSGITFNEQPLMKALQIGEKARDAILSGKFDQVINGLLSGDFGIHGLIKTFSYHFIVCCIGTCQHTKW